MSLSPREKLAAAILRAIEPPKGIAPYFGAILRGLVRREMSPETEALMEAMGMKPTLFVTGDGVMQWSAKFIDSIDVGEVTWSLIHEVMHVVLDHPKRAIAKGIPPLLGTMDDFSNSRLWNLACFPPGTLVGNAVPIESVGRGDALLGQGNKIGIVEETMQREFSGKLVKFRPSGCLPVEATPEHPVLVSRRRHKGYPIRLDEPTWVDACDVRVGDYVYFAQPPATTSATRLPVQAFTTTGSNGRGANRVILKRGFPLTPETAWLLGLWTAEGSGGESCTLALGVHEKALARKAVRIAASLGFSASHRHEKRNTLKVYIGSTVLSRALWAWCGRGAHHKRVPDFILNHSDVRIKRAFLAGVADGDGHHNRLAKHITVGVASRQLAAGLQMLLAATGRFGWLNVMKQKTGRKINGRVLPAGLLYRLTWSNKAEYTSRVLNGKRVRSHSRRWRVTPHGIALPVVAVSRRQYRGPVYNFSTSTHTYTAGGVVVHNCDACINEDLTTMNGAALPGWWVLPATLEQKPGLTTEERYALLRQKSDEILKQLKKAGVGAGGCGTCSGHPVPGEPAGKNEDGRSEAEMERFRKQTAEDVKEACGKSRGTVPASLERWANEYLKPAKVDWRMRLARLVRGAVAYKAGHADFTWQKLSRRQAGVGFGTGRPVIPALHAPKPTVACLIDTSGSMGEHDLSTALVEVRGVLKAVGAGVTVCVCDAEVHGIQRVDNIEQAAKMLKGGGGTAMAPGLLAIEELKEKVSVCVVCTDGYIDDPPEPSYSVIWCVIGGNTNFKPPFGEVVFVDET